MFPCSEQCVETQFGQFEYASPIFFRFDDTRLEKLQNDSMRVILNCPRNAVVDTVGQELGLPTKKSRVEEINIINMIKQTISTGGRELVKDIAV